MKYILTTSMFFLVLVKHTLCQQDNKSSKSFYQLGYVAESLSGESRGLQGVDIQFKSLLNKFNFSDSSGYEGLYINPGLSYQPGKDYSMYQLNLGVGIYTKLFGNVPRLTFDCSLLTANYYFGKVHQKAFTAKTVDFGMHLGLAYNIKNKFGVYTRYSLPGMWNMLFSEEYLPPAFISMGIQF